MVKFKSEYLARMDEKVICDKCGKQIRRGQCCVGFKGNVCVDCVRKWREAHDIGLLQKR